MTLGRRDIEAQRLQRAASKAANLASLCAPRIGLAGGTYAGGTSGERVEKEDAVRSEEYRRLVAALPCKHCGIHGYSQAAHPNTGKAIGKKLIDDRLCFPLCTVHPAPGGGGYLQGCHARFDQEALYPKAVRREIEPAWGADTRRAIKAAGNWPARLPEWSEA